MAHRKIIPPEGWKDSSDDKRKFWLKEAEEILAQTGIVPENTVQSWAVAWDYFEKNKNRSGSKTISNYERKGRRVEDIATEDN